MGLYNFKSQFVPFIKSGAKTHTIRGYRNYPDKPGDIMHLYTGLRTKDAKLLMRVPCVKVEDILITKTFEVAIGHIILDAGEKELLARRDGFRNFAEMMRFWDGRLPFKGQIVHWQYLGRKRKTA